MTKNLISIQYLSKDEILDLINFSNNFIDAEGNFRKEDLFPDKTVANVFCEPSTRTKSSFCNALFILSMWIDFVDFDKFDNNFSWLFLSKNKFCNLLCSGVFESVFDGKFWFTQIL